MAEELDAGRRGANAFEELRRQRFRRGVELAAQHVFAKPVLAYCLGPLTTAHVSAHCQPISILAARIAGEESESVLQSRLVLGRLIRVVGQPTEDGEKRGAEASSRGPAIARN